MSSFVACCLKLQSLFFVSTRQKKSEKLHGFFCELKDVVVLPKDALLVHGQCHAQLGSEGFNLHDLDLTPWAPVSHEGFLVDDSRIPKKLQQNNPGETTREPAFLGCLGGGG